MRKIYLLLVALTFCFAATSFGQTAPVSTTATATIFTPISLAKNADLSFGNIAVNPTASGGIVTLPATLSAIRTFTGGITLPVLTGSPLAAKFTVSGEGSSAYTISLPASVTLTNALLSTTMVFVPNCSITDLATGALSGGTQVFYVGGNLTVAATQGKGVYNGTFNVSVNYN